MRIGNNLDSLRFFSGENGKTGINRKVIKAGVSFGGGSSGARRRGAGGRNTLEDLLEGACIGGRKRGLLQIQRHVRGQ